MKGLLSPDNDAARRCTGHKDVFDVFRLTDNVTEIVVQCTSRECPRPHRDLGGLRGKASCSPLALRPVSISCSQAAACFADNTRCSPKRPPVPSKMQQTITDRA